MKHEVLSLEELRKSCKPIRNVNEIHQEHLSPSERFAIWITTQVGTMGFFAIIFFWTLIWLTWNTLGPSAARFDPVPGFVLWLFISNTIQIFLMPLIMVGQNLDARHSEARAEADFEVKRKAEREVESILMHLENQNQLILHILERLDQQDKPSAAGEQGSSPAIHSGANPAPQ